MAPDLRRLTSPPGFVEFEIAQPGGIVARAKSTARAEARRRHRAATAAATAEDPALEAEMSGSAPRAKAAGPASRPARPGMFGSFRGAIRPVHFREDLADLPRLATRTFAIWVPCLLILVIAIVFEASGGNITSAGIPALAFNLFVFPPPLAAAFLAGILTQRSSYLAGLIAGSLGGILFSIYVLTASFPASATGAIITNDVRVQNALYALVVSPVAGVAVGGFAGFYRRFLRMANPNAGARSAARGSKPAQRRR
jgi:hypothetical protein